MEHSDVVRPKPDGRETPPPCMIYIDLAGKWFHKGAEIIRKDMIRMFFQSMVMDSAGNYVIIWDGKPCLVDVADTAYVVQSVTHIQEGGKGGRFSLELNDGSSEYLDPGTLQLKTDTNVPYCRVKEGVFPARLTRQAYYQLAQHVIETDGAFYLPAEGKLFHL